MTKLEQPQGSDSYSKYITASINFIGEFLNFTNRRIADLFMVIDTYISNNANANINTIH